MKYVEFYLIEKCIEFIFYSAIFLIKIKLKLFFF